MEFRPLEVQLTDFENAAYAIVVVLLSRCVLALSQRVNFYLPMSLVEENMRRAQRKDAVTSQKFWMRKNAILPASAPSAPPVPASVSEETARRRGSLAGGHSQGPFAIPSADSVEVEELTLDEIFNGKVSSQGQREGGLLPLLEEYLQSVDCSCLTEGDGEGTALTSSSPSPSVLEGLLPYLKLLRDRAAG